MRGTRVAAGGSLRQPKAINVTDRGPPAEAPGRAKRTASLGRDEASRPLPSSTIIERLRALLGDDPSRLAFTFIQGGSELPIDYATLMDRAARYGAFLQQAGTEPADVVLIILQHDDHLLYAFFGAMLIGARPAILAYPTPKLDPQRWAAAAAGPIENISAKLLVTCGPLADRLSVAARSVRVAVKPNLPDHEPLAEGRRHAAETDDSAFLQFSSGTTGLQKGLALTHRAVIAQIEDYSAAIGLTGDDRIVSWLPLYHDMGLVACMLLPVLTGTPCVWLSPFEWVEQPRIVWLADDDPRKHGQVVFGLAVQPADGPLPATAAVLVLTERDKDFQRRVLDRFEPTSEVVCPAAYSSAIPAPKCWTFAASPQETFLNPERRPVQPGRWDA